MNRARIEARPAEIPVAGLGHQFPVVKRPAGLVDAANPLSAATLQKRGVLEASTVAVWTTSLGTAADS